MSKFKKASKSQTRLRLALIGPSGSGKTYSALAIASGLAESIGGGSSGSIAVIDTEHGSAAKYAGVGPGRFQFDTLELASFDPRVYIESIQAADAEGYSVLIIDSLSHAWTGKGGALDLVDKAAKRSQSGSTFNAWRDVTPLHNALIDAILACRCHVVATMRTKVDYVLQPDPNTGRMAPRKVGMAPIQREGMDYEFDVVCDLDLDHNLIVGKTRCPEIDGIVINKVGEAFARQLVTWLTDGSPTTTSVASTPAAQPPPSSLGNPGSGERVAGRSPAPTSAESQPQPTGTLPAEMAADIRRLITVTGMTDYQVRTALAARGVSEIERLDKVDAQSIINKLEQIASRQEFGRSLGSEASGSAESIPATEPTPEPTPEPVPIPTATQVTQKEEKGEAPTTPMASDTDIYTNSDYHDLPPDVGGHEDHATDEFVIAQVTRQEDTKKLKGAGSTRRQKSTAV